MSEFAKMLNDDELKADVVKVLAEFFEDSFKDDPAGVGDWLARNGTSVDSSLGLSQPCAHPRRAFNGSP